MITLDVNGKHIKWNQRRIGVGKTLLQVCCAKSIQ